MTSKINHALKRKRELALMSQTDVSILLGITLANYNEKERGKRDFTQSQMKTLAKQFNCTLDELFGEGSEHDKVQRN